MFILVYAHKGSKAPSFLRINPENLLCLHFFFKPFLILPLVTAFGMNDYKTASTKHRYLLTLNFYQSNSRHARCSLSKKHVYTL